MSTTSPPAIILLLGEIGAGKSSFINTAAGVPLTQVGHELKHCTTTVQQFSVRHPECQREVYFVDTPGFNRSWQDEGEILDEIIKWLKRSDPNVQFGGIIYLYDLCQPNEVANRRTIMRLNERESLRRVVLTTLGREGSNLETRLKHITDSKRMQTRRFTNSKESAWSIVDTILAMGPIEVGTIHGELVRIRNQLQKEAPSSTLPTLYLANQSGHKMSTTRSPPVIILLLGEIGAGKSSFINTAAGVPLTQVGHEWEPCTTTVQQFSLRHPECQREVYFVDTPGFNHPQKDDGVILNEIIDWLKRSDPNVQFGGIIYLYDLSQAQEVANRRTIMRLNEPESLRRVVLTTLGREGSNLETRLKDITGKRVQIQRFTNSKESAWSIVDTILAMGSIQVGTIHGELARISDQLQKPAPKPGNRRFLHKLLASLF